MSPTIFSDRSFADGGPRAQTTDGSKRRPRKRFEPKAPVYKSRPAEGFGFGKTRNDGAGIEAQGVTTMPLT